MQNEKNIDTRLFLRNIASFHFQHPSENDHIINNKLFVTRQVL